MVIRYVARINPSIEVSVVFVSMSYLFSGLFTLLQHDADGPYLG